MNNKQKKNTTKSVTDDDFNGITNEVTFETDVTSNPFPFTEENNSSFERVEYGKIDSSN